MYNCMSAQFDSGSSGASGLLKLQVNGRNLLYVNSWERERGRREHVFNYSYIIRTRVETNFRGTFLYMHTNEFTLLTISTAITMIKDTRLSYLKKNSNLNASRLKKMIADFNYRFINRKDGIFPTNIHTYYLCVNNLKD